MTTRVEPRDDMFHTERLRLSVTMAIEAEDQPNGFSIGMRRMADADLHPDSA